ncbi:hypothetical protein XELAEV_18036787mg [Xenopus laevis]|uniref:Uncharacterized protein n=1 Tax=Xenopus laevis TaxID=8355 RepID=A0A974CB57_XENLA|nr:hypothetical protein XELAEV_18036787mg [Xenopus laevis]
MSPALNVSIPLQIRAQCHIGGGAVNNNNNSYGFKVITIIPKSHKIECSMKKMCSADMISYLSIYLL